MILHLLVPDPPVWLDEGLAEVAAATGSGDAALAVPAARLSWLKLWLDSGNPPIPFDRLAGMRRADFYADPPAATALRYAQAAAMVHWCMSGKSPRARAAFERYLRELRERGARREGGVPAQEAFTRAWEGVDLRSAEREFGEYVRGLME
ncbi:MAG: hypothetical protein HZA54_15125 [Planctomycetes bacterium]|nr:hypothetical protein [Planctomycetota bacterium]